MKTIIQSLSFTTLTILLFTSCQNSQPIEAVTESQGNLEALKTRAEENLESSRWNRALFQQDIETYNAYSEVFAAYPLNNYPFPVADYDYAVYSNPFTITMDSLIFKGIQIGEYVDPTSDSITTKLTLIVLTNDDSVEADSYVDSRNYPYLTAEGNFNLSHNKFEWVFSSTPDGFSSLFFSMKFFDLRFGETIIIYPQKDNSFLYEQLNESPNNCSSLDEYINRIKENKRNLARLKEVN